MFVKCPKIDLKRCAFAGYKKNEIRCGLVTGPSESTKDHNLPKCTKDMSKSEVKKYVKGFTPRIS